MKYVNETVAVGVVMMDAQGYDTMQVFQGTIRHHEVRGLYLDIPNEEPMEMSETWLAKLKPVEPSLGAAFQGAQHCLIIASVGEAM